jgi:hypothetical protein
MIIDIHSHLFVDDWLPHEYWWGWVKTSADKAASVMGKEVSYDEMEEGILSSLWDPTGELLIDEMGEEIDKTVILPQDFGFGHEAKVSIEDQNYKHAEIVKKYPNKLIAFAGVDPRRKSCPEFLERCVKEWGMKGLKIHPAAGFFPNDERFYPLYEKAMELRIPVLFHSGPTILPYKSKFSHPNHLDDIATDFPDLRMIAAHTALGWWRDLLAICSVKANIMVDISGWEVEAGTNYGSFCHMLRSTIDELGCNRILFGTDGPCFRLVCPPLQYMHLIKNLPQNAPKGIEFTEKEVSAILGGNAQKILNL